MARGLDLVDRREPGGPDRLDEPRVGRRDLGVGGDDIDGALGERLGHGDLTRGERRALDARERGRTTRHVRAPARDDGPGPLQGEDATAVAGHEEARPPPRRLPVRGPRPGLVDVATQGIDRRRIPGVHLLDAAPRGPRSIVGSERGGAGRAADPVTTSRPADPGTDRRLVRLPAERIQHQVPGPDVADLATTEPGLEVRDAAGREPPQVVAGRAGLAGRPDRLPLEEVVRPRVRTGRRSSRRTARRRAVRSAPGRASRPARHRPSARTAAVRGRPGAARPRRRGTPARSGSGTLPGPRSRDRSGRTRRGGPPPRRPRRSPPNGPC